MRALVVYESMFGNTRAIAEAVADGLRSRCEVSVRPVGEANETSLVGVSLLVVGGPTHMWGMSRPSSRRGAAGQAERSAGRLVLEPAATGRGLREWLAGLHRKVPAAAFDTRIDRSRLVTGAAAPKFARVLRQRGCRIVAPVESFRVSSGANVLLPGELDRARAWGAGLAAIDVSAGGKLRTG